MNYAHFTTLVKSFPDGLTFGESRSQENFRRWFAQRDETMDDIEDMFRSVRNKSYNVKRTLVKRKDPGQFLIPARIGGRLFAKSLCDTKATCNLMPSSIADKLGITNFSPPARSTIRLADESECVSIGELHDKIIEVGGVDIIVDFTICNLYEGGTPKLLFGQDFLYSVGAIMDWQRKKMCLTYIDSRVFYHILPP